MRRWNGVITSRGSSPIRSRMPWRKRYRAPQDRQDTPRPSRDKRVPVQRGQRITERTDSIEDCEFRISDCSTLVTIWFLNAKPKDPEGQESPGLTPTPYTQVGSVYRGGAFQWYSAIIEIWSAAATPP